MVLFRPSREDALDRLADGLAVFAVIINAPLADQVGPWRREQPFFGPLGSYHAGNRSADDHAGKHPPLLGSPVYLLDFHICCRLSKRRMGSLTISGELANRR